MGSDQMYEHGGIFPGGMTQLCNLEDASSGVTERDPPVVQHAGAFLWCSPENSSMVRVNIIDVIYYYVIWTDNESTLL